MGRALGVSLIALAACAGGRDVEGGPSAPASPTEAPPVAAREAADAADGGAHGYERLLQRPRATFGLAESRGVDAERMRSVLEGLADSFEACAAEAERGGWLARGAVRLVVELDSHGQVRAQDARLDDPNVGGKLVLLCLVAPLRAQNYGDSTQTARRGFALEVLFGPAGVPR